MTSFVNQWVKEVTERESDDCIVPPFKQSSLYWNGMIRSLAWIMCEAGNGPPADHILVPIRRCNIKRCACKHHYRWGTKAELSFQVNAGKSREGVNNPNAKLSWAAVDEIRGDDLVIPKMDFDTSNPARLKAYNERLIDMILRRQLMADKYKITLATLDKVLRGYIWKEIDRPAEIVTETAGDEF